MVRWSWSDFFGRSESRSLASGHAAGVRPSSAIGLDLDELIAARGRRSTLGRQRRIDGFRFGELAGRRRGVGLDLDSIGPYEQGDDIRHMDWLATARTGRAQVKQFRHDVQQTIIAAIDLRPHMVFGTSGHPMIKTACLAAAALAWITSKDHQPFGALLIGAGEPVFIPPKRGRRARLQHLSRIVEGYHAAIADRDKSSPPLADGLGRLTSAMAVDVEAVIISDFSALGEEFDQTLREAGARGSISAILVEDRLTQQAPPAGSYPVRSGDDQTVTALAIRAGDENVYTDHAERHQRRLTARLLGLGARQALVADPSSMTEGFFR